jgi:hypothetical protein
MKLYGGIDLHSNNSVISLLDENDRLIYEQRLPNELDIILVELASYREVLVGLVVESTFNWYWLVDGLMEAGYTVHLSNPACCLSDCVTGNFPKYFVADLACVPALNPPVGLPWQVE